MSEILLARNIALTCLHDETRCKPIQLPVQSPLELTAIGFTHSPQGSALDEDSPMNSGDSLDYLDFVHLWAASFRLTIEVHTHEGTVRSEEMENQVISKDGTNPDRIYVSAPFENRDCLVLFPGETYIIQPIRRLLDPVDDIGLSLKCELWGHIVD